MEETIVVAAPAAPIWRALTHADERACWWTGLHLDPQVGGQVIEHWSDDDGRGQVTRGEVLAVDDGRLLRLRWADADWAGSTRVEFSLEDIPGGTRVVVREFGLEQLPNPESLGAEHRVGWRMHLGHLRRYVEDALQPGTGQTS